MNHWIVKSEPTTYSWDDFVREGRTAWTGVRNYQSRNNLRAMKKADLVFFYHSGEDKTIVGLGKVAREAYPDPTAKEGDWSCVDLEPVKPVKNPVALAQIKKDSALKDMVLARNSRLSVSPVTTAQSVRLLELAV